MPPLPKKKKTSDIRVFLGLCLNTMSFDPQKFGFLNQLQLKTKELRTFGKKHYFRPSYALFSAWNPFLVNGVDVNGQFQFFSL